MPRGRSYTNPSSDKPRIPRSRLQRLKIESQIEVMREWFFENYEDPNNRTPYESAEGGYIYIWGGPYDAREELEGEFGGFVKNEAIEELESELMDICWEWTKAESPDDYDDFDDIRDSQPLEILRSNVTKVKRLIKSRSRLKADIQAINQMMVFGQLITLMETFLCDVFTKRVFLSDASRKRFLAEKMADRSIKASHVYEFLKNIDVEIKLSIDTISFHNILDANKLFTKVLDVEFEKRHKDKLIPWIEKRHNFIHRAGKDKAGNAVATSGEEIKELIETILDFAEDIDQRVASLPVSFRSDSLDARNLDDIPF
jgi:hypothetical protein